MEQILLGALSLGLLWSIMTIGVYISYRVLDVADLTVEGSITLGAAVCARLISGGADPYLALLVSFLAGMGAGLVTGLLHTKLRIPALISGILTMIALYSVNLRVMGMANVSLLRMTTVYSLLGGLTGLDKTGSVILLGGLLSLFVVGALYWFFGTEIGSAIRATGNNPNMVRAQGIHTDTTIVIGLMLANALVSLSGGLIAQSQNYADVQMGTGAIVIGLASLIIGEVLFGKRNFFSRLLSMIFGAITYRVIIALVLRLGMAADDLKLFTAITVALALALPRMKDLRDTLRAGLVGRKNHAEG
ncbi:MAG: ABC transporter permease [Clostridiales bacterium]|nr:ABC transporter permease [Clostridiales bacterium]